MVKAQTSIGKEMQQLAQGIKDSSGPLSLYLGPRRYTNKILFSGKCITQSNAKLTRCQKGRPHTHCANRKGAAKTAHYHNGAPTLLGG